MHRTLFPSIFFCMLVAMGSSCSYPKHKDNGENGSLVVSEGRHKENMPSKTDDKTPASAKHLICSYPEQRMAYRDNKIIFPDGTSIVYDDGRKKDFVTMLDNSDVEDMFALRYDTDGKPDYLADAGRSRCDKMFQKMYGGSEADVQKHLVPVQWFGQKVRFTSVNGANKQLEKVAKEIESKYPQFRKYMKSVGTFYWRKVRGANRMSAHSYGIAIDINTEYADYWLWKNGNVSETKKIGYANRIPMEIVHVFEKYGFIWGGRWYHYDTMHFEYRPEINTNKYSNKIN